METRKAVVALLMASGLVGLVGLWVVARDPDPQRAGVGPAIGAPSAAALPDALQPLEVGPDEERAAVVEPAPGRASDERENAEPSTVPVRWMRSRIVDEHGAPLAGASMSYAEAQLEATSGPDGAAALAVPLAQLRAEEIQLEFTAEGRTTEQRSIDLRPEGDGHAGEVALVPAGSLVGRLAGAQGSRLDLRVGVFSPLPPLSEQDLERIAATGRGLVPRGPNGRSKQDGSFRIDGVPVGTCIVAAHQPGSYYVWSEPLAVQAGQVVDAGTLVFRAPDLERCIQGVVLDAEGTPSAAQPVELWKPGVARNVEPQVQSTASDPEGRFRFAVPLGSVFHVILLDAEQREEIARVEDVAPGAPPLVLRIPPERSAELVVRSSSGEPVEEAWFRLSDADGFGLRARTVKSGSGLWRFDLPARPFRMWVNATGFESQNTDVLDPATTAQRIEFTLQADSAPRIRCVVTRSGAPVAQAVVVAYETLEGPHRLNTGFATRLASQASARATASGEPGTYDLRVRRAGSIVLLVHVQERVVLEHGPIHVAPGDPERRIELALPEPGSIEGRVLLSEGRDPAGLLIGASRGDGEVRAMTLGSDAAFRFEGLAPGSWQVQQITQADNPHLLVDRRAYREQREPTWDVRVEPGQVARFDLDLLHEALCRIRGRVRLSPDGPTGWRQGLRNVFGQVESDGSFVAETYEPGAANLTLVGDFGPSRSLLISEQLDLAPGETTWVLDLLTAELELSGVPAFEEDAQERNSGRLRLSWTGPGLQKGVLRILSHGGGLLLLPGLPPGRWTVETRFAADGTAQSDWRRLDTQVELAPGDRQTLAL